MAFTFDFDDGDLEQDHNDVAMKEPGGMLGLTQDRLIPPQFHRFNDMLSTVPVSLSYSSHTIPIPSGPLKLPRRAIYDIRAQLMTECDPSVPSTKDSASTGSPKTLSPNIIGLSADDITPGLYEGGFKTWECSSDLAAFVSDYITTPDAAGRDLHVVELGAGTSVPSSALLVTYLALASADLDKDSRPLSLHLTAADYNPPVIRLASVPNIFLAACVALQLLAPSVPDLSNPQAITEDDIEISPALCSAVGDGLRRKGVSVQCIEGAWGKEFVNIVDQASQSSLNQQNPPLTLVIASETIYAPSSLPSFTETLVRLLQGAKKRGGTAKGFVAAKRMYFGVGGGVAEFERELLKQGGRCKEVWGTKGDGVGRCILEVEVE